MTRPRRLYAVLFVFCASLAALATQAQSQQQRLFSAPRADSSSTVSLPSNHAEAAVPTLSDPVSPAPSSSAHKSEPRQSSSSDIVNGTVSLKTVPFDTLRDQKYVWLFPLRVAEGHHILPTAATIGITAGLIQADPPSMRYFGRTTDFNRFNESFNGSVTGAFEGLVPASLYVFGLVRHDNYAEQTALLAGMAYADSAIPHVAIKVVSRRIRPNAVPAGSDYSHTFFRSSVTPFGKGSSFPSGHAAAAFSIATVIAQRYRDHRWVPWAAYSLATIVAFSRIPARAHYPSDVFLGGVLGYAIARYDTLRPE